MNNIYIRYNLDSSDGWITFYRCCPFLTSYLSVWGFSKVSWYEFSNLVAKQLASLIHLCFSLPSISTCLTQKWKLNITWPTVFRVANSTELKIGRLLIRRVLARREWKEGFLIRNRMGAHSAAQYFGNLIIFMTVTLCVQYNNNTINCKPRPCCMGIRG